MDGYDIDGVITAGLTPGPRDIIVTGRSYEEAAETYQMLRRRGIFNAVYFNPEPFHDRSLESSGNWKAHVINLFKLERFYEDDPVQIEVIEQRTNTHVVKVGSRARKLDQR